MFADAYIAELPPSGGWIWQMHVPSAAPGEPLWTSGPESEALSPERPVITTPAAIWMIDNLQRLPLGWDGYDGRAPSRDTIETAKALYWLARTPTAPSVQCAGDGEVSLVWRKDDAYLELGVDANGAISFYGRAPGVSPLLGDLDDLPDSLPESLVKFLGEFGDGRVRLRERIAERV
jgi:hypothetical protein